MDWKKIFLTTGAAITALGGIAAAVPIPVVQVWAPLLLAVGAAISAVNVGHSAGMAVVKFVRKNR